MPEKIVFFSLRYGLLESVIKPIASYLESFGFEIVFVHANSISSKLPLKDIPNVIQYDVYDVGFRKMYKLLRDQEDALYISLGYKSLFDILFVQVAENFGRKSLYMEHGLFVIGLCDSYNFRFSESIPRYFNLVRSYFTFLALNPGKAISFATATIKAMGKGDYAKIKHNSALFYTKKGAGMVSDLKFSNEQLNFSGYPLVADFSSIRDSLKTKRTEDYVVFLHQPVIKDQLVKITYDDERKIILDICNTYKQLGLKFIFKIHPRESMDLYKKLFEGTDVTVTDGNLFNLVQNSKYIISQFSTAIFFGVLLNIPIIVVKYPTLDESYVNIFKEIALIDPTPQQLQEIDTDYNHYLHKLQDIYNSFRDNYIGYDNSFYYQAATIKKIAESH